MHMSQGLELCYECSPFLSFPWKGYEVDVYHCLEHSLKRIRIKKRMETSLKVKSSSNI
jgi:hypothetical protein